MKDEAMPRERGVQSVRIGVELLTALARNPGPMTLSRLAAALDMPAAKAHRYLASFVETGMVAQRRNGAYDLGYRAAEIGIAAVSRVDQVNHVADALPDLVERTEVTASLSVWSNKGPTIVRWERAATPLVTTLGLGAVLPVTRSATGRAFMAHLPDRLLRDIAAEEAPGGALADFDALRAEVRATGVATADQEFIPGLYALAAPLLDLNGRAEAVVTLISSTPSILEAGSSARVALSELVAGSLWAAPSRDVDDA